MPNIEGIGLEENGVTTDRGKIVVDEYYRTSQEGIYAIGDVVPGPALAHVASAEALVCVEKIAGHNPEPVDYGNIPACTYTTPEVASCGMTEEAARAAGKEVKTGKFMFMASGKASASGARDGFVKLVFDASDNKLLGAQMTGMNVTELIASAVMARRMGATATDIMRSIHPHPTMSEAVMEAAAAAMGEAIHG
jgi:dihydrolipoamide dehydrogenase